jgi:hypothetical protein
MSRVRGSSTLMGRALYRRRRQSDNRVCDGDDPAASVAVGHGGVLSQGDWMAILEVGFSHSWVQIGRGW